MAGIIITSIIVAGLIITFIVFGINLIFALMDKNNSKIKKSIVFLVISFLLIGLFSVLDLYFIATTVYKNRKKIVEFTVESLDDVIKGSSQILSKSLRYTADDLWNNWDNEFVRQLENIDLEIIDYKVKKSKKIKIYAFEIIFNNNNQSNSNISYEKIFRNNYLTAADKNDILYSFIDYKEGYQYDNIPKGKTKAYLKVNVEKDIKLAYIQFVRNKIEIE